jgi:NTE family protein
VLDRIAEEKNIIIDSITATSAGAMNATVFLYGLHKGGATEAKNLLEKFWHKVSYAASLTPIQPGFIDKMLGITDIKMSPMFQAMDVMRHVFSPYQLNYWDINPLRDILNETVDFDAFRKIKEPQLFVNATKLQSGKMRVFTLNEITNKALLASACLPYVAQTVVIDGEKYWDGGFSGNPALAPLIYNTQTSDIVIVQVTPFELDEVPTSIPDIIDRANEISFNTSLIKETKGIEILNDLIIKNKLKEDLHYRVIRLHMISNSEIMSSLGRTSKMNADWAFLCYLRDVGRQAVEDWIESSYQKVGKESSVSFL